MPERAQGRPQVAIAERFRRSIHLEADWADGSALEGYIVSPLARETAERMLAARANASGAKAWTLVGPYGSGKSSFVSFLVALAGGGALATRALDLVQNQWPRHARRLAARINVSHRPIAPILVTGQRGSIAAALLRGLRHGCETFLPEDAQMLERVDSAIAREQRSALGDREVVEHYTAFRSALCAAGTYGGVGVFVDEMGKLLEWAARHPDASDIYLLQLIAESAARSSPGADDGELLVVTTLHQSLEAYAEGLPLKTRLEWSKVEGRFELIPYLESSRHLVRLQAGAIRPNAAARSSALFAQITDDVDGLHRHYGEGVEGVLDLLGQCAPMHPTTALCLGPLFRMRLGQNERSLFAFLSSREPFGFQSYLGQDSDQDPFADVEPYGLDRLYDYVVANTGIRVNQDTADRTWSSAEQALARLPREATEFDARLIKCIALLDRLSTASGLRADPATLANATQTSLEITEKVLGRLVDASIIVWRKFKNAYQIWDGSDLDLPRLLRQARRRVRARGGFAEALQELVPPEPILAPRHYHRSGTLRFFDVRFARPVRSIELLEQASPRTVGDGDFLLMVPDDPASVPDLEELARKDVRQGRAVRPRVIALPMGPERFTERLLDYFALEEVLATTPQLAHDVVAKRDLGERRLQALDRLEEALTEAFWGEEGHDASRWFYDGERVGVFRSASSTASRVFDDVYAAAPVIKNEMINTVKPTPSANRGLKLFMERLFTHVDQPKLGIEGFPLELAIYRSLCEITGLHTEREDGTWALTRPPDPDRALGPLWAELDRMLDAAPQCRMNVRAMIEQLAMPPMGLRPGALSALILLYYLTSKDALFFYEDNTFVPSPAEDVAARLMKQPLTFELQRARGAHGIQRIVTALGGELLPQVAPERLTVFPLVRAVMGVLGRLSTFAAQTQRVSGEAKRVRSELKSARDPVYLVTSALPRALDFDRELEMVEADEETLTDYAKKLRAALGELARADEGLDAELEDAFTRHFDTGASASSVDEVMASIAARAKSIAGSPSLPAGIRGFVTVMAREDDASGERSVLERAATVIIGKAPRQWYDRDVTQFTERLAEIARGFAAAEQLALELGAHEGAGVLRVAVLDASGSERTGLVRDTLTKEQRAAVKDGLEQLAKRVGVPLEHLGYALVQVALEQFEEEDE